MTFRYAAQVRANNIKSSVFFLLALAYMPFLLSMHDIKRKKIENPGIENNAVLPRAKIFNQTNKTLNFRCLKKLDDQSLRMKSCNKQIRWVIHLCIRALF